MHKGVKEREKMSRSRITQSFKSDKKLIWKSIYSDAKIRSGNLPAQIPRKLKRRWIIIQPLNVGDKGVAKIKWRRTLGTEESGMSHKKMNTCYCDLTQWNQIIRQIRRENQNPHFLPRSRKARFWGAIVGANCTLCSNCIGGGQAQYLVLYVQTA